MSTTPPKSVHTNRPLRESTVLAVSQLSSHVPEEGLALLLTLSAAPRRVTPRDVASSLYVGQRQARRRLQEMKLPAPRELANWIILIRAADTLSGHPVAARTLARTIMVPGPTFVYRIVRRYLDCTYVNWRGSVYPILVQGLRRHALAGRDASEMSRSDIRMSDSGISEAQSADMMA